MLEIQDVENGTQALCNISLRMWKTASLEVHVESSVEVRTAVAGILTSDIDDDKLST